LKKRSGGGVFRVHFDRTGKIRIKCEDGVFQKTHNATNREKKELSEKLSWGEKKDRVEDYSTEGDHGGNRAGPVPTNGIAECGHRSKTNCKSSHWFVWHPGGNGKRKDGESLRDFRRGRRIPHQTSAG